MSHKAFVNSPDNHPQQRTINKSVYDEMEEQAHKDGHFFDPVLGKYVPYKRGQTKVVVGHLTPFAASARTIGNVALMLETTNILGWIEPSPEAQALRNLMKEVSTGPNCIAKVGDLLAKLGYKTSPITVIRRGRKFCTIQLKDGTKIKATIKTDEYGEYFIATNVPLSSFGGDARITHPTRISDVLDHSYLKHGDEITATIFANKLCFVTGAEEAIGNALAGRNLRVKVYLNPVAARRARAVAEDNYDVLAYTQWLSDQYDRWEAKVPAEFRQWEKNLLGYLAVDKHLGIRLTKRLHLASLVNKQLTHEDFLPIRGLDPIADRDEVETWINVLKSLIGNRVNQDSTYKTLRANSGYHSRLIANGIYMFTVDGELNNEAIEWFSNRKTLPLLSKIVAQQVVRTFNEKREFDVRRNVGTCIYIPEGTTGTQVIESTRQVMKNLLKNSLFRKRLPKHESKGNLKSTLDSHGLR